MRTRRLFDGLAQGHVSWEDDHRNAAARERRLYGDVQDSRHLLRLGHQLTIVAALREEMFGVGFLKVSAADLTAGNLRGDGEDGDAAAMGVVEAVDQMKISGAAASGADGQSASEMRFRAGGERRRLFMSHVNPSNSLSSSNRVGDSVERVACDSVDSLDVCRSESIHNEVRYSVLRH